MYGKSKYTVIKGSSTRKQQLHELWHELWHEPHWIFKYCSFQVIQIGLDVVVVVVVVVMLARNNVGHLQQLRGVVLVGAVMR